MPILSANRTLGELTLCNAGIASTGNGANNYSLVVQNNGGQSGSVTVDGLSEQFRARLDIHQSPSVIDLDTDELMVRRKDGAERWGQSMKGVRLWAADWRQDTQKVTGTRGHSMSFGFEKGIQTEVATEVCARAQEYNEWVCLMTASGGHRDTACRLASRRDPD